MERIEIIGHLGADAEVKQINPQSSFIVCRVAVSRMVNGNEVTQWYDIILNDPNSKVKPYLVKGQQVFVRGYPSYRIFDSAKYHTKMVGITVSASEIQLVGKRPDQEQAGAGQTDTTTPPPPPENQMPFPPQDDPNAPFPYN